MKIFVDFRSIALTKANVAVTVGVFDGVHIGHQTVIQRLISKAKNRDLLAAILIFDPSPVEYFQSSQHKSSLTDRNQKITIFERLGLDLMVMVPFSSSIVRQSADEFLQEVLIRQLRAKAVVSGYDWQFGKGRAGNPRFLKSVGERYGVDIEIVAPRYIDGKPVHSTWIRKEVERGNLNLVANLLGRKYAIAGTVIKGDQRGRKIGFPTVNINTGELVLPPSGVYAIRANFGDRSFEGVLNMGTRPSFDDQKFQVEAHLFDFNQIVYGQQVEMTLVDKIREERKFSDLDGLTNQIRADIDSARSALLRTKF